MSLPRILLALHLASPVLIGGHYAGLAKVNDSGGGHGTGGGYAGTISLSPGGVGATGSYSARTGFAGQLGSAVIRVTRLSGGAVMDGHEFDHGRVPVGSETSLQLVISNLGTANLSRLVFSTSNEAEFRVAPAVAAPPVAARSSMILTVIFSPDLAGARAAVIGIASNDTDAALIRIHMSGIGVLPPEVDTLAASPVRNYAATLHGMVNPNHGTTTLWFEYSKDATMTSGLQATAAQGAGTGAVLLPFSAGIAELLADSGYFARAVAQNEAGRTDGPVTGFHTLPPVVTDDFMTADSGLVGGGSIYRPFSGVINQAGRVSFEAAGKVGTGGVTSDNSTLLLSDASGSIRVVARKGGVVQTAPWQTLSGLFNHLLLTEAGQSVAMDRISGAPTTTDQTYIASRAGVDFEILSREGDSAPLSGEFKAHAAKPAADSLGRVYFSGDLSGAGVTTKNDSGIYQESAGTLVEIAREGEDVSHLTGDPAWLGGVGVMVAAAGDGVAFTALLQNHPADAKQKTSTARNALVLAGNENGLEILARKGDAVPGTGGATLKSFSGVSRGAADSHAYLGLMNTGGGVTTAKDQVLVAVTETGSHLVAREGVTVAGGVTLVKFGGFYATSAGEVIFEASGVLCRWTEAGGIEELARLGGTAVGTGSTHHSFAALSVSEGGAVALLSRLASGASVLWRALPFQALSPVVSTGEVVAFDGVDHSVLAISLYASGAGTGGGGGGMGSGINDGGEIFTVLSIGGGKYVTRIFR